MAVASFVDATAEVQQVLTKIMAEDVVEVLAQVLAKITAEHVVEVLAEVLAEAQAALTAHVHMYVVILVAKYQ